LFGDAQVVPVAGKVFLHHVEWERVMSRRHRRVGSKDTRCADLFGSFVKRQSLLNEFARSLEEHE
jgi:hypothetical protein